MKVPDIVQEAVIKTIPMKEKCKKAKWLSEETLQTAMKEERVGVGLVTKSCPTLRDPIDCSRPGSSVHGIFQERILEWGAIAFSETILRKTNAKSQSGCLKRP